MIFFAGPWKYHDSYDYYDLIYSYDNHDCYDLMDNYENHDNYDNYDLRVKFL